MKLDEEQFKALEAYESHFNTAVNARWSRHPGERALQVIHGIYTQVTGDTRRLNSGCQSCILHLLQDCGRLYFAEKAERAAAVPKEEPKPKAAPKRKTTRKTK